MTQSLAAQKISWHFKQRRGPEILALLLPRVATR